MEVRYNNKAKLLKFLRKELQQNDFLEGWDLKKTMFEGYLRKII